jgi:hypothetical protein
MADASDAAAAALDATDAAATPAAAAVAPLRSPMPLGAPTLTPGPGAESRPSPAPLTGAQRGSGGASSASGPLMELILQDSGRIDLGRGCVLAIPPRYDELAKTGLVPRLEDVFLDEALLKAGLSAPALQQLLEGARRRAAARAALRAAPKRLLRAARQPPPRAPLTPPPAGEAGGAGSAEQAGAEAAQATADLDLRWLVKLEPEPRLPPALAPPLSQQQEAHEKLLAALPPAGSKRPRPLFGPVAEGPVGGGGGGGAPGAASGGVPLAKRTQLFRSAVDSPSALGGGGADASLMWGEEGPFGRPPLPPAEKVGPKGRSGWLGSAAGPLAMAARVRRRPRAEAGRVCGRRTATRGPPPAAAFHAQAGHPAPPRRRPHTSPPPRLPRSGARRLTGPRLKGRRAATPH